MSSGIYERSEEHRLNMSKSHKGKIISQEQRKKISKSLKKTLSTPEARKKMSEANKKSFSFLNFQKRKNHKHSEETKQKIGRANKGKKRSLEQCQNLSKAFKSSITCKEKLKQLHENNKGRITSIETRIKLSKSHKGKNFKNGNTPESKRIRESVEQRLWREAVFARDGWTCQDCHSRSGNGKRVVLNAHHVKLFSKYPELRTAIDNGITLCIPCHRNIHNKITLEQ